MAGWGDSLRLWLAGGSKRIEEHRACDQGDPHSRLTTRMPPSHCSWGESPARVINPPIAPSEGWDQLGRIRQVGTLHSRGSRALQASQTRVTSIHLKG